MLFIFNFFFNFETCLGAFASCNGDTWASELATVLDSGLPILITTGKTVPKGNIETFIHTA